MKNPRTLMVAGALFGALSLSSFTASAQDEGELAKKLQNPERDANQWIANEKKMAKICTGASGDNNDRF